MLVHSDRNLLLYCTTTPSSNAGQHASVGQQGRLFCDPIALSRPVTPNTFRAEHNAVALCHAPFLDLSSQDQQVASINQVNVPHNQPIASHASPFPPILPFIPVIVCTISCSTPNTSVPAQYSTVFKLRSVHCPMLNKPVNRTTPHHTTPHHPLRLPHPHTPLNQRTPSSTFSHLVSL